MEVINNNVTNSFTEYSDITKSFGVAIVNFIKEKCGTVPEIFKHSIHILLTNYEIFQQAREDVLRRGAIITEKDGSVKKNISYKILNDSQIFLNNLMAKWGCDLKSMKQLDSFSVNSETDLMTILEDLEN